MSWAVPCLCTYPLPTVIMYDRGNEFLGHVFRNDLIKILYGIKAKCATTENPQVNSILERIRKVIVNLVSTFDLKKQ